MDQGTATSVISGRSNLRRMSDLVLDLQRQAGGERDLDSALDELTGQAAQLVPGASYAAITISRRPGEIHTLAATDRYPVLLDEIQRSFQEGPCVLGEPQHQMVRVDDLSTDERWPRYSFEAVAHTPIRALMSFQLFAHRPSAAALNLYSEQAHAFGEDSVTLGLVFAAYTTLTWSTLRREQQFRKGPGVPRHHRPSQRDADGALPRRRGYRIRVAQTTFSEDQHPGCDARAAPYRIRRPLVRVSTKPVGPAFWERKTI